MRLHWVGLGGALEAEQVQGAQTETGQRTGAGAAHNTGLQVVGTG